MSNSLVSFSCAVPGALELLWPLSYEHLDQIKLLNKSERKIKPHESIIISYIKPRAKISMSKPFCANFYSIQTKFYFKVAPEIIHIV